MSKTQKKDVSKSAEAPKRPETLQGLPALEKIKGSLPDASKPKEFYIPIPLTDIIPAEGGARCDVRSYESPDAKKLEACWGYETGSICDLINIHLISNSALPVERSVVGVIELLPHFTVENAAVSRHGYPYKNRSECRFPGYFKLIGFPDKGLVTVSPAITSELYNPWWVVKEYVNAFRRESGQEEITLQGLRESVDACLRRKTKSAYPPLWNFQFDKNGILKGRTRWYQQKRPGWRYVNVDTQNKRLEGIHRVFSAFNIILWEKF